MTTGGKGKEKSARDLWRRRGSCIGEGIALEGQRADLRNATDFSLWQFSALAKTSVLPLGSSPCWACQFPLHSTSPLLREVDDGRRLCDANFT